MDKKEILHFFRKDKIFVTPEALDFLYNHQDLIEKVKEKCIKDNVLVLSLAFIEELLKDENSKISITFEYPEEVREFSVEDVVSQLKSRFEFLSSVLIQNNQLKDIVSINKLVKSKKELNSSILVGMIKDKTTYTFTLEDFSGCVTVRGEASEIDKLDVDDVVGVEVLKESENFISKKIYYPSFSFFRKIGKLGDEVLVNKNKIVVKNREYEIKCDTGVKVCVEDVRILLLNFKFVEFYLKENYIEKVCLLLEKRHLLPSISRIGRLFKDDFFLLREIPDYLVFLRSKENNKKIYKGVQIYFVSEDSSVLLKEGRFVF